MRIVAIIQARMGSTRLPGKVMKLLGDKTVLAHVISRVKSCLLLDEVIVATTTSLGDDLIVIEAEKCGVKWFRGSEENVLERYYLAAQQFQAEIIVRITSDCPLFDPEVLSQMLYYFKTTTVAGLKIDYLSNTLNRTYPIGLDAEVFTFKALERAVKEAHQPYEKEHVTPYIYQHPDFFTLQEYTNQKNISNYRWTLDTEEDWQLIQEIYSALSKDGEIFKTDEVLTLLKEKSELVKINAHVQQKKLG